MAELLKGAPAAAALTEQLARRAEALRAEGVVPTLAILRVGEREDDISYETGAMKRCAKAGVEVRRFLLPAGCGRDELLDTIRQINADPSLHGCLMFRPLADREREAEACALLAPEKDVDGMTAGSLASVFTGEGAGYAPCTAQAVTELLDYYGIDVCGKRAVVVGRSLVIGRPVSMLLQRKHATVTMCHTRTADLAAECRRAEILIVAAGRAGVITGEYISPGQTVIDVGIHVGADGKLCGDVKFGEAEPKAAAITPVPGGVGSMTTAILCKHVIEAAEKSLRQS